MKKTLAIVAVFAMILSLLGVALFSVRAEAIGEVSEDVSDAIGEISEDCSDGSGAASEETSDTSEGTSEDASEEASENSGEASEMSEEESDESSDEPPAETDLWIAIDRTAGAPGGDVTVDFTVKQNPGFWGISLYVDYDDSVLTLKSLQLNPAFRGTLALQPVKLEDNPFVLRVFANSVTADFTQTGVLATATFTMAEDAPIGTTTNVGVRWRANDVINVDIQNVSLVVWNGSVKVVPKEELPSEPPEEPGEEPSEEPSAEPSVESDEGSSEESAESSGVSDDFVIGDANGDNSVDMKDVLKVRKFIAGMGGDIHETAADVNRDGSLDMKDVLLMRKFIAGILERLI